MCKYCRPDPNDKFWSTESLVKIKTDGMLFAVIQAGNFLMETSLEALLNPEDNKLKILRRGAQQVWDSLYPQYRELVIRDHTQMNISLADVDKLLEQILKGKGHG